MNSFRTLVLFDLRTLQRDVSVSLHVDLAGSSDKNVLAGDLNRAVTLQGDARVTCSEHDGLAGIQHKILGNLRRVVLPDAGATPTAHVSCFVATNRRRHIGSDLRCLSGTDGHRASA